MKLSDKCKFQEVYKLTLSLGEGKDHPYASGTSSTVVSVSKDYDWVEIDHPVVVEAKWYDGGILAPLEFASEINYSESKLFILLPERHLQLQDIYSSCWMRIMML